ncbi:hypothetical protein L202_00956 [Cryptococcus amylolentus CBS 6039]|uniref:Uncharacterized protein n=1 Tax=Cryptococcus amylolentus CBS 6039 TaxID=1295533 RepID=A0A1E3I287_9TREE|nr:hypothetical protein L202_00956 [Cryptococcus amylolentus CBS 6039]ODN82659.1 hypothetical protein L202_00956 [Cryptococcus amylolentus CBS 6039]
MADTGPSSQTGGLPAVPQSVNETPASTNEIFRLKYYGSDDSSDDTEDTQDATVPQPVNQTPASINSLSEIFGSINPPIATDDATSSLPPRSKAPARAGSTQRKGKAPAIPPPSQSSVDNAYPFGLGHPANGSLRGPLRLVPFDLAIPHHYPNGFTINPYSNVGQLFMGSLWTKCYPIIPDGPVFQNNHFLRYLRQFYVDPTVVYPTSWETNVDFSQTSFYIPLGKEFTDLEIVQSVREHAAEEQRLELSSQATSLISSLISRKLGGIKPDVCLTGYHIGHLAEGTYRREPAGGGDLRIADRPQKVLYALIGAKWLRWPEESTLDLQGKIDLHLKGLQFANMEAITQTIYYSLLGFDLSKCRSAIAWVNGDYTRILNLSGLVPGGKEAVLEGVTLGGGGGRRSLVESDPAVVAKLRYRKYHCLSPNQFVTLAAGDPMSGTQCKEPNSLIANYEDWSLDQEAKDRLDATVYLYLALATHHPEAIPDPPISNHSLTHVINANTSEKEAYQWLHVSKTNESTPPRERQWTGG